MPATLLAPPDNFHGREEFVARFKARLDHYNLFLYEGISGIGTTSLIRRLAKETRAVGVKAGLFLRLVPGEGVTSILARVEALTRGKSTISIDRQGDPFGRLIEALTEHRLVLLLDGLHALRREDMPALVRALRAAKGPFRVLATIQGDPELSAMDAMLLHKERVGPLTVDEVRKIAASAKVSPATVELLVADAARGGSAAQPLTLRYLLSLCGNDLPPKELLDVQTARSVNAFRAVMSAAEARLTQAEKDVFIALAAVGEPIAKSAAAGTVGAAVTKLLSRHLLDEIAGDVYVHPLVAAYFGQGAQLSNRQSISLATHLRDRAVKRAEPLSLIRAGKLLAQAGKLEEAVGTLADGWEAVRDLGFSEAYLKIIASIPATGSLAPRLALLSAQARMRQGTPQLVREELERLAGERDGWTRTRALAALTAIYSELEDYPKVVKTFDALRRANATPDLLIPAGPLAATAMVKLGQVAEAEKLGKSLLGRLKTGQDPARHGELHRLLSQVYAQMGQMGEAVDEAALASKFFTAAGDLYHAATAAGFIGDLYRETGEFEQAQTAYRRFHELATKWGDRNLIQIADLSEAWVSLDIGDLTSAQRRIAAVEKDLSATASRRLRRYLAAAKALLEVGRGHWEMAVEMLPRVVETWDVSGPRTVADMLRAQLVRSYISVGRIDEATQIVNESLERLDPKTAAPRVAMFLRESALIHLRAHDGKRAMAELAQSCKLFAQGGNRREEAHTLYRIAHAAFDEGDLDTARARLSESRTLADRIKHTRVIALCRELEGRIALVDGDVRAAAAAARDALAAVKRLGDELGSLHVSELLISAQLASGDLAAAIRLGPRLSEQAESVGLRELRIRAITLTGVALLRKARLDQAQRCFREIPESAVSAWTSALMWRFGEALALAVGDKVEAAARRDAWADAVRRLPAARQPDAIRSLEQLELPPRERSQLRTRTATRFVTSEQASVVRADEHALVIDLLHQRAFAEGRPLELPGAEVQKLFAQLVVALPGRLSLHDAARALFGEVPESEAEAKVKPLVKDLVKALRPAREAKLEIKGDDLLLVLPKTYGVIVPMSLVVTELTGEQRKILKLLRKVGTAPLTTIEAQLKFERPVAKREVDALVRGGLLEPVKAGSKQAFRLA